jgi:hypothetical protein
MIKYKILGLMLIYFFLIGIKPNYQEIIVKKEGKPLTIIVNDKHKGGGNFRSYFLDFEFNKQKYDVKVSKTEFEEIEVGQKIQVLYKSGVSYFVMPNAFVGVEFILTILCLLSGVFFMFYKPNKEK